MWLLKVILFLTPVTLNKSFHLQVSGFGNSEMEMIMLKLRCVETVIYEHLAKGT